KAGIPIITRKLSGGIASIAILNKDQTELQTTINNIKSIILFVLGILIIIKSIGSESFIQC
ncbi:MAG: hypothetical protein CBC19_04525, partial [Oceanospirillales bacterium TMED59]